jgi:hypothetical protein
MVLPNVFGVLGFLIRAKTAVIAMPPYSAGPPHQVKVKGLANLLLVYPKEVRQASKHLNLRRQIYLRYLL